MKLARLAVILLFATLAMPAAHAAEPTIDERVRYLLEGIETPSSQADSTTAVLGQGLPPEAQERMTEILQRELKLTRPVLIKKYTAVIKNLYKKEEIILMYERAVSHKGQRFDPPKRDLLESELFIAWKEYTAMVDARFIKAINSDPILQGKYKLGHFRVQQATDSY